MGAIGMNRNTVLKMAVDIGMVVILLLLMAFVLVGAAAHEWLGIGMFGLCMIHHILNRKWSRNIFRGKYTPLRVWQTFLAAGIFLAMAGSMYSGMILSEYALSFLPIKGGWAFARVLHMASAYWGFVLMSLHIGLHWKMMAGIVKKHMKEIPMAGKWLIRITAVFVAGYGVYAFRKRDIWNYMVLRNHFAFFDFEEPVVFFLTDYAAVMFLFAWTGHYFLNGLRVRKHLKRS